MDSFKKIRAGIFITLLLLVISFSFLAGRSFAADAFPDGGKVPCDITKDPEFNSIRPYQASPCGDAPKAYFCSNSVEVVIGTVHTPYCESEMCECKGKCDGKLDQLIVDLTGVQLPVLGNTQQIKNGTSSESTIDEATLMNEYVSSYLGGTINRAEYGETNPNAIVDFSGPVKKLLPTIIQDAQRIAAIQNPSLEQVYTDDEEKDPATIKDVSNHNQIVVCGQKEHSLPLWITDFFHLGSIGIGREIPIECYSNGSSARGDVYRLTNVDTNNNNWSGKDGFQESINWAIDHFPALFPNDVIVKQILANVAHRWPLKIPPLPWADQNGKPFATTIEYEKAYNEWQGQLCAIVSSHLFCLNAWPYINNPYADLFPYIPLVNTTDKKSNQTVNSVEIKSSDATIDTKGYSFVKGPSFYFAHTQESADLSNLLQTTFKPQGSKAAEKPGYLDDVKDNASCQIVKSYSNPGDDVTFDGDKPKSFLEVDGIYYHVTEIKCPKDIERRQKCTDPNDPHTCKDITECSADVTVTVPMQNKSPYLDDIWKNTVAGEESIFRRIYPKTGESSPVSCIMDTPGASKATYTSKTGIKIDKILGPDGSNIGTDNDKKSIDAQVFFPHLGGVASYFLKGIQTALRPQGYGEKVEKGICVNTGQQHGTCKQWLFEKDDGGTYYYTKVIAAAAAASCKGKHLNPFWAIAIALNENGGLMSDNPSGDSNTHFGCNISLMQSIDEKISCMVNTLTNDCVAGKTDDQTLGEYGYPPGYIMYPITVLAPGAAYPPPLFGSGFNTTLLLFNLLHTDWVAVYKSVAPTFCPNSPILEPSSNQP